jgi:twinkle protein
MRAAVPQTQDVSRLGELVTHAELIGCPPLRLRAHVERLWDRGMPPGEGTGWPSVDRYYTVAPGQFTVITGWPGSGKSEWLDALVLNLARRGWRFAIFSPENQPAELHVVKFVEKFLGKPFGDGPTARATKDEAIEAMTEMEEWFGFLLPAIDTERVTFGIEDILRAAELQFRMGGIWRSRETHCGLVIDPWNEIEHARPRELSETEYVSATLGRIRAWARASGVHVWIVAHPQKLPRDRDSGKLPVPRPDHISGSQHWWNKADNAITVWRALDDTKDQAVQIHVQKVRFKHVGRAGVVELTYDRVTGRYHEPLGVVPGGRWRIGAAYGD